MKKLSILFVIILCAAKSFSQCSANFSSSVSNLYTYTLYGQLSTGIDGTTTYAWNFGDGGTSTLQNPTHTFAALGTYHVCLKINTVSSGCVDSICKDVVIACPAHAYYTYYNPGTFNLNFTNASTGTNNQTHYHWDFGDGDTSNQQILTHTFAATGIYHVCLTVTNVTDHCSDTYCQDISVCSAEALYTYTHTGNTYQFTDHSAGTDGSTTYHWDFGNGDSSNQHNPSYTFNVPGTYNVCMTLTVGNLHCTDQYCLQISAGCLDSAKFSYVNTGGLTYHFTDLSTGTNGTTTYAWSFGDGGSSGLQNPDHSYAAQATNTVCLTVDNVNQNCSNMHCEAVVATCNVHANFTYSASGNAFSFTDASIGETAQTTYAWTFGDAATSSIKNPSHTYSSSGVHHVCLTINDPDIGCSNQYCADITGMCADTARYTYTHTGNAYNFTDASVGEDGSVTFNWNFGDGGTSTIKNPSHTFTASGTYHVCLTIDNVDVACISQYCTDITVSAPCADTAIFSYGVPGTPNEYHFADASVGNPNGFSWTFGDGGSSTDENPVHTYTASGDYVVCLSITETGQTCPASTCDTLHVIVNGISETALTQKINVYPNPANNILNVDMGQLNAEEISVFDYTGRLVYSFAPKVSGIITVDVNQFSKGLYVFQVKTAQGSANVRVLVSY